jgi:hypothetical protein
MSTSEGSRSIKVAFDALVLAILLSASMTHAHAAQGRDVSATHLARQQLSIGYSLLYQEAKGLPKLDWLLALKNKDAEMGEATDALMKYYQSLTEQMEKLSKQFPAMRLDVTTMSDIEAEGRKSMGVDQAKNFMPIAGKTGKPLEREALITFRSALDEQRHLVGIMIDKEPNASLKKFLESSHSELNKHYDKVDALLERRYFAH